MHASTKFDSNRINGRTSIDHLDHVIVSGLHLSTNQFIPNVAGKDGFQGELVHSSQFDDTSAAKDKCAAVIRL